MNQQNLKKQIVIPGILVALISVILIGISIFIYSSIQETQKQEIKQNLKEIVSQYSNIITTKIDGDFQTLEAVSIFVGETDISDLDQVMKYLEAESRRNSFLRMGYVTPDGIGYFVDTDGTKHYNQYVGDEEFVREAFTGRQAVSDTMKDRFSENTINCYGVPVYHEGELTGVLTATSLSSKFSEIIEQKIFEGIAYVHVIDEDGNFIVRSHHVVIQEELSNIFDKGEFPGNTKEEILSDMRAGKEAFANIGYEGTEYWMAVVPVGIKDWHIYCVVPQKFLNSNFNTLLWVFLSVMLCMVLLFAVLFFYIYRLIRRSRETMEQLAYTDTLTGADNRNRFTADLPGLLRGTADNALVLFNISGFKFINEFFGYETGNRLLKHIAAVLKSSIEEGERYYRDSADRFGIFMDYKGREEAVNRLEQIQKQISDFSLSQNQSYHIICNFGVKVIEEKDCGRNADIDTIMNRAMLALNSVKGNDYNAIAFYDEVLHQKARKKSEVENKMYAALENREFCMVLQPKYALDTGEVHSAEALVRWYTKDGTVYYPDEFIPIFEENGFITKLDMYMLEEACRYLSRWLEKGYPAVPVSVNQSRLFFYDSEYMDKFHEIVDKYHLDPSLIILEVTESVTMNHLDQIKEAMERLHAMGFRVSMDDFGSGYSSLNILNELYIDELKLDKEFLSNQEDSCRGEVIMRNIINLARDLSITTVVEGVETEQQVEFLKSISCDIVQGYYFAKPMSAEEFEEQYLKSSGSQN
ncbi:EAL domain-containing protein [Lactonifactor longoviformis]|uniref:bifunctional diguanylate cyclase/phosphodiesterase n=1 Tax=Lactonifactor longoviformis TaxID=341220 RepID=UPI002109ED5A|nr:EAL domain-containing protein [Lactonifactor longoviformis]MCQ4671628.1 EAL domain-containing protein [Lactonifactor longoviformis]